MRKKCPKCYRMFSSLKGRSDICDNCKILQINQQKDVKQKERQTKQKEIINKEKQMTDETPIVETPDVPDLPEEPEVLEEV
jgi:hypothetical protein